MDLLFYIIFSAVYVMIMHFAMAIRDQFNIFFMLGFFIFGGLIGWYFSAYEIGFVTAVVLSLVFW